MEAFVEAFVEAYKNSLSNGSLQGGRLAVALSPVFIGRCSEKMHVRSMIVVERLYYVQVRLYQ